MTYDAWKLRSDLDDAEARLYQRGLYQCDVCGEVKPNCRMVQAYGMDCIACEKCLGDEGAYDDQTEDHA